MMKCLLLALFCFNAQAANVKDYGAVCNGVTDDTLAIQATIDANQLIEFPVGNCFISATLTANKPIVIQGVSRQLSGLTWTNPSMDGLRIITDGMVDISRMGFHAPINATSGNMLYLTGDSVNAFSTIKDSLFTGGYSQFNTTSAYAWILDGNYHYGYVAAAVVVRNTFNADYGDSTIINSVMSGGGANSTSIVQYSSGGLRLVNNKLLGGAYAYRLYFFNNEVTSDLIIANNSIENQSVAALAFGTANQGAVFANILINDNQFMNQPMVIAMNGSSRFISRLVISDNSMSVVKNYGIILTNIEDFIIANNQITGTGINGIAIGAASQNGKVSGNRTKGFAVGISNGSTTTTVN